MAGHPLAEPFYYLHRVVKNADLKGKVKVTIEVADLRDLMWLERFIASEILDSHMPPPTKVLSGAVYGISYEIKGPSCSNCGHPL